MIVLIFSFLRLYLTSYINQFFSITSLNRMFLSIILFFFFISFTILNYSLEFYSEILFLNSQNFKISTDFNYNYVYNYNFSKLWSLNTNSLNIIQVYTYPFIYVFLLVTILSIVYCLTYNIDDLLSFMFYCQLILLAGYVLFFTDSIVLFFLFYEFLLIPSFFILYKFAKTRRCVEAAYLMFF